MNISDLVPWSRRRRESLVRRPDFFDEPFFSDRFLEKFLGDDFGGTARFNPKIDVSETENEIEVIAELPGLEQSDIDLTLESHGLTLRGEKREERKREEGSVYRTERSFGSFQRYLPLSSEIDREQVKATFKNGVLKIHLPKLAKPENDRKKIKIGG